MLVTYGSWHVDGRGCMLMLLMTVLVGRRCREPRLSRVEHVTRNSSQLIAVRRQMRVGKTLCLCRMRQDVRRSRLLGERV